MPTKISLIGKTFGRLKVISDGPTKIQPGGGRYGTSICLCQCGRKSIVANGSLNAGRINSCGCLNREIVKVTNKTHGHTFGGRHSPTYMVYRAMLNRCFQVKNRKWADYGGRGITVCQRWLKFENFLEDMGIRPKGLTLGRLDHDKGYYPENCKWQTYKEQAACQRPTVRFYAWCL